MRFGCDRSRSTCVIAWRGASPLATAKPWPMVRTPRLAACSTPSTPSLSEATRCAWISPPNTSPISSSSSSRPTFRSAFLRFVSMPALLPRGSIPPWQGFYTRSITSGTEGTPQHYHMIPTHQDHVLGLQQVMTNQQPVELTPIQPRSEKAVDRPVTAPFAAPTRKPSHGHTTADREYRLDHSSQLAKCRRLNALA